MIKLNDILNKLEKEGIELGRVYTDKDRPPFQTNEASIASWSDDKKTLRWKVYIDGEKEPLILTGRSANEVKKFAHQMINNNSVKIKKVVKEGKLNEAISLKDAGGEIFDTVIAFKKIYEKSPHKKNRKINSLIKQILKIEQQLSDVIVDLDEGKLNEASYRSEDEMGGAMRVAVEDLKKALKKADRGRLGPEGYAEKYHRSASKLIDQIIHLTDIFGKM